MRRLGQSILEYALLIAIVMAALVVMQTFTKRGYQGRLKSSSDQMSGGEHYSASGSTTLEDRRMLNDKSIHEEIATDSKQLGGVINNFGNPTQLVGIGDRAYHGTAVVGGATTSVALTKMSGVNDEGYKPSDYTKGGYPPLDPMSSDANDVFH